MTGRFDTLSREGSDRLENGDPLGALERFAEAEAAAEAEKRERELCGMLGDKAVAFNRVGNTKAAIATYRRAIDLCRRCDDTLNLSRWTSNLISLLSLRGRAAEAEALLNEMLDAALRSGRADQIAVARLNQATLLSLQGRFKDALRRLDEAAQHSAGSPVVQDVIRRNRLAFHLGRGEALRRERRGKEAIAALETALRFTSDASPEDRSIAQRAHLLLADLYERGGDAKRSKEALEAGRKLSSEPASDAPDPARSGRKTSRRPESSEGAAPADLRDELAADAELTERLNRTGKLLESDPDKAIAEFEALLPHLRRVQDRRRELILIINFLPEILKREDLARAAYLADRCLELSRDARTDHRIVALLRHAAAAEAALHDRKRALDSYREAFRLLQEWVDAPPGFRESMVPMLAEGALLAVKDGDLALATEIAKSAGLKLPEPPRQPSRRRRPISRNCAR
jgi:tetratricopeptide (TPR) repeat protein